MDLQLYVEMPDGRLLEVRSIYLDGGTVSRIVTAPEGRALGPWYDICDEEIDEVRLWRDLEKTEEVK